MLNRVLHHDLPLAFVLFHTLALRWVPVQSDGFSSSRYGFPAPAAGWGGVSSLEWSFSPALVTLDLAALLVLVAMIRLCAESGARRLGFASGGGSWGWWSWLGWIGGLKMLALGLLALDLLFVVSGLLRIAELRPGWLGSLDHVELCLTMLTPQTGDPQGWCSPLVSYGLE